MSKVVSTKLTEEEYGKLVGLCSSKGFTISKLLKRAILERIQEDPLYQKRMQNSDKKQEEENAPSETMKTISSSKDDRFLYY